MTGADAFCRDCLSCLYRDFIRFRACIAAAPRRRAVRIALPFLAYFAIADASFCCGVAQVNLYSDACRPINSWDWDWRWGNIIPNAMYQLKSQTLFLTYPQCPIPFEDFVQVLFSLPCFTTYPIDGYVISREAHQDGGTHYHCLLSTSQPVRTRDSTLFDLHFDGVRYHGNYQSARNVRQVYEYVIKDGEFFEDLGSLERRVNRPIKATWASALEASSYEEACEIVQQSFPREWINNGERIRANLRHQFPETSGSVQFPTFAPESFTVPPALSAWVRDELNNPDPNVRRKSLILYGPSRTGKSCWARSLGPHIYQTCQLSIPDLLGKCDERFVILDDFPESSLEKELLPFYKSLFGCQPSITLRALYRNPKLIEWNVPVVWLCNNLPAFPDPDWMRENCVIVQIRNKLF